MVVQITPRGKVSLVDQAGPPRWEDIIGAMDEATVRREFLVMVLRSETPNMIHDLEARLAAAEAKAVLADEVYAAWKGVAPTIADVTGLAEWPMDWLARYDALRANLAKPPPPT